MTPQEYKDLAKANGYDLGTKIDLELLADYAFHKAACTGMEDEVFNKHVERSGEKVVAALVSYSPARRVRFMVAMDCIENGSDVDTTWNAVCGGMMKRSDIEDQDGKLIEAKL